MYLATCGYQTCLFEHPKYELVQKREYNNGKSVNLQWNSDSNVIAQVIQKEKNSAYYTEQNKKFIELSIVKKHEIQDSVPWSNLKESISTVCFSKNNPLWLAVSTYKNQVSIYNIKNQSIVKNFQKYSSQNSYNVLDFSQKDNYLAAGCFNDGIVELFSINRNTKSTTLSMSKLQTIQTLNFNPLHKNDLAAGGYEGDFVIWDTTSSRKKIVNPSCHTAPITVFKFSPTDGKQAYSVGLDCVFKLYDLSSSESNLCQMTKAFDIPLNGMSILPNGQYIAISSIYDDIFIMDLRKPQSIVKQFQVNSDCSNSKREIYQINYLNGEQKKSFEIDNVECFDNTDDTLSANTSLSVMCFDFNKSASIMSNITTIDSHESADFLLWDKFKTSQSSPIVNIKQSPLKENQQVPSPKLTPILLTNKMPVLQSSSKKILEINVEENKENINQQMISFSKHLNSDISLNFTKPLEYADKAVQVCLTDNNENKEIDDKKQLTPCSSHCSEPLIHFNPFENVFSNPTFIMEYLMDYAEFKVKEEIRYNNIISEIKQLSNQISSLDDQLKYIIDNF